MPAGVMQLVTVCSVKPLAQSTRKRGAPLDLTADPAIPRPAVSPSNSHSYIGVASPALMPRPNFARRRGKSRSSAHLFGFSVWSSRSAAALRYPASLTVRPLPFHCASLLRSAATPVAALATVLLAHIVAFAVYGSPCPRSTTATQRRDSDSPHGLRGAPSLHCYFRVAIGARIEVPSLHLPWRPLLARQRRAVRPSLLRAALRLAVRDDVAALPPQASLFLIPIAFTPSYICLSFFVSAVPVRASIGLSSFTRDLCNQLSRGGRARHKTVVDPFVRSEYRM